MKSTGFAGRLVALGAGVAMAATAVTGLLAAPAAAANTEAAAASKPKVWATKPTASPRNFSGQCPVEITFSAKISVRLKGVTKVQYRWLHGDGSKSKIKTLRLKGNGVKRVTVKEKATFSEDLKGWQALQILKPQKVTTAKRHFTVSCQEPTRIRIPKKPKYVKAHVNVKPSHYYGFCTPGSRIVAEGTIRVSRPTWVKYRWIHNGRVVDYGRTKVWDSKRVHYSFTPRESHRGWVELDILSPRYGADDRDFYRVTCKTHHAPIKASARVDAPHPYKGFCPVGRTFTAAVSVNQGGGHVKYRWAGPGYRGPVQSLYFPRHGVLTERVSHTVQVNESGKVVRWIEILGPNSATSNHAAAWVKCVGPDSQKDPKQETPKEKTPKQEAPKEEAPQEESLDAEATSA
ncbi:hypothetical protein [Thermostaphylospora chromogena]|uniref:PKD domain-containing protein n=1 Tax=Thermostaphylospora chromogena TaxID=35622 RepID=A0A1H1B8T0_9ACTN|nr:hypothetical protein [Thermostaphylospora chromogena]SDQ48309.1 hypothetical protein SAMN04489764_0852 [Thermostaphylospora chromogena]